MKKHSAQSRMDLLTYKHWIILLFATISLTVSAFANIVFAFYLAKIIDASIRLNMDRFTEGIIGALVTVLIGGLCEFIGHNLRKKYAMLTIIDYKAILVDKILGYSFKRYLSENQTYYLNLLTEEINTVQRHYYLQLSALFHNGAQIVFGLVAMVLINWKFAGLTFLLFILPMVVPGVIGPILSLQMKKTSKENEKYIIALKGILEGFEVVKTYNLIPNIKHQFDQSTKALESSQYKVAVLDNAKDSLATIMSFIVQMGAISIGVYFVFLGQMEVGILFGAIQIINGIVNPISSLAQRMSWIKGTKAIRDKHSEIILTEGDWNTDGLSINQVGEIKTSDLNFDYNNEPIIKHLNLQFKRGKKYAIIGPSGSGKSTLMKLLMGYYDEYGGHILIDDKELRDINKENYYKHISMIHQDVFLFEDTFENNIKLYQEVSQSDYNKAIKQANLSEVSERLGSDSIQILNDGGQELSGGERQRIAIARNLLMNTDVLLLDEAASALDPHNAALLYKTLFDLDHVTCIVVTHNWDDALLESFDEVIQMDHGSIINQGKWKEIKKNIA